MCHRIMALHFDLSRLAKDEKDETTLFYLFDYCYFFSIYHSYC